MDEKADRSKGEREGYGFQTAAREGRWTPVNDEEEMGVEMGVCWKSGLLLRFLCLPHLPSV